MSEHKTKNNKLSKKVRKSWNSFQSNESPFPFVLQNVKKKMYGCTEAFLADVKWILHNCIIYNGGMLLIDINPYINVYTYKRNCLSEESVSILAEYKLQAAQLRGCYPLLIMCHTFLIADRSGPRCINDGYTQKRACLSFQINWQMSAPCAFFRQCVHIAIYEREPEKEAA